MAKLAQYRQIIQKVLSEYRDWAAGSNQLGVQEWFLLTQNMIIIFGFMWVGLGSSETLA
jgi:hypothetical protein